MPCLYSMAFAQTLVCGGFTLDFVFWLSYVLCIKSDNETSAMKI